MKILVVSNMYPDKANPSYGVFVKRFCNQLKLIGIEYDKAVMHKENSKIKKVFGYLKFYIGTVFKIILNKYDLIYVHYASHSSIPVIAASKLKKIKIITNVHGSDVVPENDRQRKMQKYTKKVLEISDRIVTPSEYFKEYIIEKYRLNSKKIYVYPSAGINESKFIKYNYEKKNEIKEKFKIKEDEVVIGFVGRISAGKGWGTFISGLEHFINKNDYNVKIIMVGSGSEEKLLEEQLKNSPIKEQIMRFPLLSEQELVDIYNVLTLLVFPTEREGESLGLVALEAMRCGVPIIASDFAAPKYYVQDDYNGYKYKVREHKELSKYLEKFLSLSDEEKSKMSSNAYDTAGDFCQCNIKDKLKVIIEGDKE